MNERVKGPGVVILLALAMLVGCEQQRPQTYHHPEVVAVSPPLCKIAPELRLRNYQRGGEGSCAHVACQNIIRDSMGIIVKQWRISYGGGALVKELSSVSSRYGLEHVATTSGELELLVLCHKLGIPATVFYFKEHAVNFIRFSRNMEYVVLMEVNGSQPEIVIPSGEFIRKWNAYGRGYGYEGGVAFTFLVPPTESVPQTFLFSLGGLP